MVKARGAGDALGVDAEPDVVDVALVEHGEGIPQHGESEATVAPGPAHADGIDDALAAEHSTETDAGDRVAIFGQESEIRGGRRPPG